MPADLVGQTLGHFRIDAKIGEGGMGVVYRAIDEDLGRVVALKVLPEDIAKDEDRRARFLREARLGAGITHPNVVTVYEVGEGSGRIFIAMELLEGKSLRQHLAAGPMPIVDVLVVASGIARALARAHERGIVHRDLKPDNVIVGEALEPKVLDFGLAKPFETGGGPASTPIENLATAPQLTRAGRFMGSPGYMSPEQAAAGAIDQRSDIFSLGVVLYEMLTGVRPFVGTSLMEVLVATSRDAPKPPRDLRADLPPHIESAILRCLEKNPEARYASTVDLLRDLNRPPLSQADALSPTISADGIAPAMATPPVFVSAKPSGPASGRRSFALAGAGAVLLVALAGAWLLAKHRGSQAQAPTDGGAVAGGPTTLADLPLPPSKNAEAVAEYRAGMQALRDDSFGQAKVHFTHAVELDDAIAMGHLHVAMSLVFSGDPEARREHFGKAVAFRAELDDRDRGLLEALEPTLGFVQEDRKEALARLEALGRRYPSDVEILDWRGMLTGTTTDGLAFADRAIALDPKDAQAWESRGRCLGALGRVGEAHDALERCAATSLASSDCYVWLATIDSSEGRCEDSERQLRRGLDRDPSFVRFIPAAMVGTGRRPEAVREAMKQAAARHPEADRHRVELVDEISLAVLAGDFARASQLLAEQTAIVEADARASLREHVTVASMGVEIALETGDAPAAFRIAWSFVSRSDTWESAEGATRGIDDTVRLLRRAVREDRKTGQDGLSRDELEKRRAEWIAHRVTSGADRGLIWAYGYAGAAETPEDARQALAVLPEYAPMTWFPTRGGNPEAVIGRAYLLAGEPAAAARHLSRGAASCDALYFPFAHVDAALDLGEALEGTGDTRGACAAYAKVLAQWGSAKPRSVSAERARARKRALACAE